MRAYLEKCEANYRNAEADVENIEWWVRASDGADLSQPVTLFVDVTSQHHLCVVQEEQDNATNLKMKMKMKTINQFHTFRTVI